MNYDSAASLLLSQLRDKADLTQVQVAQSLGVTQSTISKFERGEMRLSLSELQAFCKAVDVTFSEFASLLESRCETE